MPASFPSPCPPRLSPARRLACLGWAALVVACQAQPVADTGQAAEATLLQRIKAEIAEAPCSSSAQCRTLPLGSKACGGPAGWIAWSASVSDGDRLQAWAADLAQRQRNREQAEGVMSTCSIVPDPGAVCLANRCVLARGNLAR